MASPSDMSGILWSGAIACSTVLLPMAIFVFFARTATPEMIGVVACAAAFGVIWCAAALLIRHVGALGRVATTSREAVARPLRTSRHGLAAPTSLVLAATTLACWIIGDVAAGDGMAHEWLILSGLAAAGTSYLRFYFRRRLSEYYVIPRDRPMASA